MTRPVALLLSLVIAAAFLPGNHAELLELVDSNEDGFIDDAAFLALLQNTKAEQDSSPVHSATKPKPVFIHIPKNAGTAVETAGRDIGMDWGRYSSSLKHRVHLPGGESCSAWHVPPKLLGMRKNVYGKNGENTFCVVRHPYERVVSEYLYIRTVRWGEHLLSSYLDTWKRWKRRWSRPCSKEALNFFVQASLKAYREKSKYILDCHLVPQADYIWDDKGTKLCRNIFHMRELSKNLLSRQSIPQNVSVGVINSHAKNCQLTKNDLSEPSKLLIRTVYADDFRRLNFTG